MEENRAITEFILFGSGDELFLNWFLISSVTSIVVPKTEIPSSRMPPWLVDAFSHIRTSSDQHSPTMPGVVQFHSIVTDLYS